MNFKKIADTSFNNKDIKTTPLASFCFYLLPVKIFHTLFY